MERIGNAIRIESEDGRECIRLGGIECERPFEEIRAAVGIGIRAGADDGIII